ncbi:MAG: VanZ family protein [Candidatus Limnocylindrales bacterium]
MHTLRLFAEGPLVRALEATVVVALVWVIITLVRARHASVHAALDKSVPEALGVAALVTILVFAAAPNPGVQTTVNLVPLVGLVGGLTSGIDQEIALVLLVGNLVLFIPIGAVIVWRFRTSILVAVVIGVLLSIAMETLQFILNNGGSVDVDDVIVNGLGALIGAAAVRLVLRALIWLRTVRAVQNSAT